MTTHVPLHDLIDIVDALFPQFNILEDDDPAEKAEEVLLEEFDGVVDLPTFGSIVDALLPLTPVQKSPLSGNYHHCLGRTQVSDNGAFFVALAKINVSSELDEKLRRGRE